MCVQYGVPNVTDRCSYWRLRSKEHTLGKFRLTLKYQYERQFVSIRPGIRQKYYSNTDGQNKDKQNSR